MLPHILDITVEDCISRLRTMELETYMRVVSVIRAKGSLCHEKKKLLEELANLLNISKERQLAEARRVCSNDLLATIAFRLTGKDWCDDWENEGKGASSSVQRAPPLTVNTPLADRIALRTLSRIYSLKRGKLKHTEKTTIKEGSSSFSDAQNVIKEEREMRLNKIHNSSEEIEFCSGVSREVISVKDKWVTLLDCDSQVGSRDAKESESVHEDNSKHVSNPSVRSSSSEIEGEMSLRQGSDLKECTRVEESEKTRNLRTNSEDCTEEDDEEEAIGENIVGNQIELNRKMEDEGSEKEETDEERIEVEIVDSMDDGMLLIEHEIVEGLKERATENGSEYVVKKEINNEKQEEQRESKEDGIEATEDEEEVVEVLIGEEEEDEEQQLEVEQSPTVGDRKLVTDLESIHYIRLPQEKEVYVGKSVEYQTSDVESDADIRYILDSEQDSSVGEINTIELTNGNISSKYGPDSDISQDLAVIETSIVSNDTLSEASKEESNLTDEGPSYESFNSRDPISDIINGVSVRDGELSDCSQKYNIEYNSNDNSSSSKDKQDLSSVTSATIKCCQSSSLLLKRPLSPSSNSTDHEFNFQKKFKWNDSNIKFDGGGVISNVFMTNANIEPLKLEALVGESMSKLIFPKGGDDTKEINGGSVIEESVVAGTVDSFFSPESVQQQHRKAIFSSEQFPSNNSQ